MFILCGFFVGQWVFLFCRPLNIPLVGADPASSILKITKLKL